MKSILVCTDPARGTGAAPAWVERLAAEVGAALHLLPPASGGETETYPAAIRDRARATEADLLVLAPPLADRLAEAGAWERIRALAFDTGTPVLLARAPIPLPVSTALLPIDGEETASGELGAACHLLDSLQTGKRRAHARTPWPAEVHLLHVPRDLSAGIDWMARVERLVHAVEFHSPLPPRTQIRKQLVWGTRVEDEIVRRMSERRDQLLMIGAGWRAPDPASGRGPGIAFLQRVTGPVMFLPWTSRGTAFHEEAGGGEAHRPHRDPAGRPRQEGDGSRQGVPGAGDTRGGVPFT